MRNRKFGLACTALAGVVLLSACGQGGESEPASETLSEAAGVTKEDETAKTRQLDKVNTSIQILEGIKVDADDNDGWGETGTSGWFMRQIPGFANAAKDLEADLKISRGRGGLSGVVETKKSGGGLDRISEGDIKLLTEAWGNLDPNTSHKTFMSQGQMILDNLHKNRDATLEEIEFYSDASPPDTTDKSRNLNLSGSPRQQGTLKEQPFDRSAYLEEQFNTTPEKEQAMIAFWNDNIGNPDFSGLPLFGDPVVKLEHGG